jgi:hypothetical protein
MGATYQTACKYLQALRKTPEGRPRFFGTGLCQDRWTVLFRQADRYRRGFLADIFDSGVQLFGVPGGKK